MSITGDKLPAAATLLGVIDTQARKTVAAARDEIAPLVARETPRKSGATAAALRPRVSRTATGAALSVGASRGAMHGKVRVAQVVRWVTRGTGVHRTSPGGSKRRIRSNRRPVPRRLILPGGRKVWSVAGQKANPFIGRIQTLGTLRVTRVFQHGAQEAARAVERSVG